MIKKLSFMLSICTAIFFTGCMYETCPESSASETAQVKFTANHAISRAVAIPDLSSQVKSYAVTIRGGLNAPEPASFNVGEQIVFNEIYFATDYTVAIVAHNTEKTNQSSSSILGSGSATFDVAVPLIQVAVVIPLGTMNANSRKGSVDLQIQYPKTQNITVVEVILTGPETAIADVVPVAGTSENDAKRITASSITAGAYDMQIVFRRGSGGPVALSEKIYVYENGVTNRWIITRAGLYEDVRVYSDVFSDTYAYLSDIKFNTSGTTATDPGDSNYVSLPFFLPEKLTDSSNYVIHCSESQYQFLPVEGRDGQTISFRTSESDPWTTLTGVSMGQVPSPIPVKNGNLYIKVTGPDMTTEKTYTIQIVQDYKLTYQANGAIGGIVPAVQVYKYGDIPEVLGNTGLLIKTGFIFTAWNTKADGSGTAYFAGNKLPPMTASVTLYAQWIMSSLAITVQTVNPPTGILLFNMPGSSVVIKKGSLTKGTLIVNLGTAGVIYKPNSTKWSYTTGLSITPTFITTANNAADSNTALVWTPPSSIKNGDYTFTVQATVLVLGVEISCTGYFKITIDD